MPWPKVSPSPARPVARAPSSRSGRPAPTTCCAKPSPGAPTTASTCVTRPSPAPTPWPRHGPLAAALAHRGPFDLVLLGRNSVDGETGQVGPEVAQLLDLPFATGVRRLEDRGDRLRLHLEHDDGTQEVDRRPACRAHCRRAAVRPVQGGPRGSRRRGAASAQPADVPPTLGPGTLGRRRAARRWWGRRGRWSSPGTSRALPGRWTNRCTRPCRALTRRGAVGPAGAPIAAPDPLPAQGGDSDAGDTTSVAGSDRTVAVRPAVVVLVETGRPAGGAASCSPPLPTWPAQIDGVVHALCPGRPKSGHRERRVVVTLEGSAVAEDVADALVDYARPPSRGPSWRRAPRSAGRWPDGPRRRSAPAWWATPCMLSVRDGALVAAKPAFAGALVADITCTSAVQMVTVRPGVLPASRPVVRAGVVRAQATGRRGRVQMLCRAT